MNHDFIQNSIITRDLNPLSYRGFQKNSNVYNDLKTLQYHRKYDPVFEPFDLKVPVKENKIYHYGLPFTHGNFNNVPQYNTYSSQHTFIPPSYRWYEQYPSEGVIYNVMKNRDKNV
jgi:hypothetical protein